jgi:flagellar biosynthesis/type III secretory pathway ATPase
VDRAVELRDGIRSFLTQRVDDRWDAQRSFGRLRELLTARA